MSNNYYKTSILPVAQRIADNLKDPLPQKMKRDFVFLVPIIKYDWCITSVAYNNHEIVYGIMEIYSNLLCFYNFHKQSRTYLYYEDLISTDQNSDNLYLNFNDRKLTLHFQIPEPSDFAAKATSALGFAGSLLSEILFDKSNLDRQLESIEQRLKNLDPNRLSPSDQAHYEYLREKEAAETLLPLYVSFFKDIIQKKLYF